MENKIQLSPKKILNKQFEIDFKGYNANEVDYYLDMIVADYNNFAIMLNQSYDEIERLQKENQALKVKLTDLERKHSVTEDHLRTIEENVGNNVDLLRRLSQLESEVYNKSRED
ncbi:MAG: DivIVA domain-containing protein [Erysipelotrichaceae bacterium]|nr:DivIVA domain-containing protein [Erysipelotrichaceae bacterium]